MTKHLWVTPFAEGEMHAAGDYPNQHPGGAGLPEWTAADRSIEDTDIVVWYSLGSHHQPRPEDWPVMPMAYTRFMLMPSGFFPQNPALDVPADAQAPERALLPLNGSGVSGPEAGVTTSKEQAASFDAACSIAGSEFSASKRRRALDFNRPLASGLEAYAKLLKNSGKSW